MKSPLALLRRAFAMVFSLILLGALVPAMLSSAQAAVASVDFGQCANQPSAPHDCEWINGALNASKAVYAENMSVPQRTMLTAITPTLSTQHSLVFTTQWTKGGQHAFDWLTSYAQAQASATFYGVPFGAMNECADISNVATCTALRAGSFADVAVPDDAYVSADGATQPHINAYETQFGNRTIRLYGTGITINSLTMAHPAGTDTGDTEATWTLTWTGNAPAVLLEMAAHVAASTGAVGWGTGTGASTISGSPYHVSLATLDGSALGSQDNQMSANVIVAPGFIQVTKSLSPTDDPGTFNLQVDSVTRATGVGNGGTTGLVQVLPGQHSVGELAATGTSLSNYDSTVACGNDQPAVGTTATVDVDEGETVSCTITNTRQAAPTGSLEVVKNLEPSNDPGLFDLLVDGTTQATDVTDAGTTGPLAVSVGSHTFGEAAGTGTSLSDYTTGVACLVGGETPVPATAGEGNWSVNVAAEQDVVCTITNTRNAAPTGTLEVVKDLAPDNDPGLFDLEIDDSTIASDVGDGGTTNAVPVSAGSHSFGETAGTGTSLSNYDSSAGCRSGESTVTTTFANGVWSVSVGAEQNVVCTITNTRRIVPPPPPPGPGSLQIVKQAVGHTSNVATFVFDVVCSGFSASDVSVTTDATGAGSSSALGPIPAGSSCTVTEEAKAGWQAQSSSQQTTISSGVTSTVTFLNTELFTDMALAKSVDVDGDGPDDDGVLVQPGAELAYTLAYANVGNTVAHATITDSLPSGASFVSIADGGTFDQATGVASWVFDIPANGVGTVHWVVSVDPAAQAGTVVDNVAAVTDGDQDVASNHVFNPVALGALSLGKAVSPTGNVEYGDTLFYTLTALASGTLDQHAVSVTDTVPMHTEYVAGSAACVAVECTATYDAAARTITWQLGDLAAGASRQVTFAVTVTRPSVEDTVTLPELTIVNVGAVASTESPLTPSNEVRNTVTAVLGQKFVAPDELPFTGSRLPVGPATLVGLTFLVVGVLLTSVRRTRTRTFG